MTMQSLTHDFLRNSESVSLPLFRASSSIVSMPLSLRAFYQAVIEELAMNWMDIELEMATSITHVQAGFVFLEQFLAVI